MATKRSFRYILHRFLSSAQEPFSLEELLRYARPRIRTQPDYLDEAAHHMVASHPLVFYDSDRKRYIPRRAYFRGARFRVVPLPDEIESGILFVGHRLTPFCAPQPDFSRCSLLFPDGGKAKTRRVTRKPMDLLVYHTLIGLERMYTWILRADPNNLIDLTQRPSGETDVRIKALDFREFYRSHDFQPGDSLVLTVQDWDKAACSVEFSSGSENEAQPPAAESRWSRAFATGLKRALHEIPYSIAEEQLARGTFYAGEYVIRNPVLNIGGFFAKSEELEFVQTPTGPIVQHEGEWAEPPEEEVAEPLLPTFLGDADNLEEILQDIGLPIPSPTFEAYMRDALYSGKRDVGAALSRCFSTFPRIDFYDEYQIQAFQQELQALWDQITDEYSRTTDHYAGKCRAIALRALDQLHAALNETDSEEHQDESDTDLLADLLSLGRQLHWLLASLNSGDAGGKPLNQSLLPEVQEMADEVSRLAALLSALGRKG